MKRRRGPVPPTWLDLLPDLPNERIGRLLSHGKWNRNAASLAQVSGKQSKAVLAATGYKIRFLEESWHWFDVAPYGVKRLTIESCSPESAVKAIVEQGLDLSQLQSVSMFVHAPQRLHVAIASAPLLRSIQVSVDIVMESCALWYIFEKCDQLREFRLSECWGKCPMSDRRSVEHPDDSELVGKLRYYGSKLEKFQVSCRCDDPVALGQYLRVLPSLRHVGLLDFVGVPQDDVLPILRKMESVHLESDTGEALFVPVDYACGLGQAVTSISDGHFTYSEKLEPLRVCNNLRSLDLCLQLGAESALSPILGQVRELSLTWHLAHDMEDPVANPALNRSLYYEPPDETLLHLVEAAPNVEKLSLVHMRVSLDEVVAILKHVGSKLVHFETSLHGQYEIAFKRLEEILSTAAVYNRNLKLLRGCEDVIHMEFTRLEVEWKKLDIEYEKKKLDRALEVVMRNGCLSPLGVYDIYAQMGLREEPTFEDYESD